MKLLQNGKKIIARVGEDKLREAYAVGVALWLMVGGTIPCLIDMIEAMASIAPAAPKRWPVIDLVELIFIL